MAQGAVQGPLRRNPANPRYFTDDTGEPVFLTGSHTWNNLQDMGPDDPPKAFDWDRYLGWLTDLNHNFVRLWAWDSLCTWNPDDRVRPFPWARTGPGNAVDGKPRLDLTQFDPEHFARLRNRVASACERGIYVSVMLFEGWEVHERTSTPLDWHVFAKDNNVNGMDIVASLADGVLRDWITLDNPDVTGLQEDYVREVVQTVNGFDNVLYEVCNEAGPQSHEWQEHFVEFVRRCEAGMAKQHPVGVTGGMGPGDTWLYGSAADWISPEIHPDEVADQTWGTAPYDRGDKVIILDTDHIWGVGGDEVWAWQSFCRGYNVIYMDRANDFPSGFFEHEVWPEMANPDLRREMGKIRAYADRMTLNAATPHNELASTGYCLAVPGREYLVYQPEKGPFSVQAEPGGYAREWHNPDTGESMDAGVTCCRGTCTQFTPPFEGGAVLFLRACDRSNQA
jgi:hypothetical protein